MIITKQDIVDIKCAKHIAYTVGFYRICKMEEIANGMYLSNNIIFHSYCCLNFFAKTLGRGL